MEGEHVHKHRKRTSFALDDMVSSIMQYPCGIVVLWPTFTLTVVKSLSVPKLQPLLNRPLPHQLPSLPANKTQPTAQVTVLLAVAHHRTQHWCSVVWRVTAFPYAGAHLLAGHSAQLHWPNRDAGRLRPGVWPMELC